MKKNLSNITLAISLIFIFSISIYFIVQKVKSENINHYLDFLGSKLMAMLPEDKKKEEVARLYDQFKQQVEEKKVAPREVEKLAVEILNLENLQDSLRRQKVERAMVLAMNIPKLSDPEKLAPAEPENAGEDITLPTDEQKWRELRERLKNAYIFEENFKKHKQEKDLLNRRFFQYDSNLHVIIDSHLLQNLLRDSDRAVVESIKELEKQKWLVWKDNYEQELKEQLKAINDSIQVIKLPQTRLHILPGVEVVVPGADSIRIKITLPPD